MWARDGMVIQRHQAIPELAGLGVWLYRCGTKKARAAQTELFESETVYSPTVFPSSFSMPRCDSSALEGTALMKPPNELTTPRRSSHKGLFAPNETSARAKPTAWQRECLGEGHSESQGPARKLQWLLRVKDMRNPSLPPIGTYLRYPAGRTTTSIRRHIAVISEL